MLLNINPIIAFALANVVYHEHISLLQFTAYCIIFLAVVVFNAHYVFKGKPVVGSWERELKKAR